MKWVALWLGAWACSPTTRPPSARQPVEVPGPPANQPRVSTSRVGVVDSPHELSSNATPSAPGSGAGATAPGRLTTTLDVPDVPPPILVLPDDTRPVPLLIGAHGAGGSPEWQCEWLSSLTTAATALLCLRGLPLARGELAYYYPEHHSLGRWLSAALERVEADHGSRLAAPFIYVGYSQGATMGALAIQTARPAIPNLLLVEGGLEGWTQKRSREFVRAGGRKVYFACGTHSCDAKATRLLGPLTNAGVEVKLGYADGAGHTPLGAVEGFVREGLTWLLETPPEPTDPQP